MNRRIVITGLGTVNPVGIGVEETWRAIREGKSGVDFITSFDTSDYDVKIAAEVKGFDPNLWMDPKNARKMARFSQFAVAAALQAVRDAGLEANDYAPERAGVSIGNGIGGFEVVDSSLRR